MKAGRELDVMVAEKVMGFDENQPNKWPHKFSDEDGCVHPRLPLYSTDIASAWGVVEKMREKGWSATVEHAWGGKSVYFSRPGVNDEDIWVIMSPVTCDSFPLAICLASLRALGVEVGE